MFHYVWFKREEREEERALYTHYYAYSMDLAVGDTIKVCLVLNGTIDNTYELTKLVKIPPKRDATLHSIQGDNNSSNNEVCIKIMPHKFCVKLYNAFINL